MANTIRFRRGSTVPSGSAFVEGEPAWNSTTGMLYCKTASGVMKQLNYNITISTANPTGGSNGDIWIRYAP